MYSDISTNEMTKTKDTVADTSSSLRSGFGVSKTDYSDISTSDSKSDLTNGYIDDGISRNVVTEDYNPISVPDGCTTIISDSNDTFASVAKEYGISEEELWNLNSDHLSDKNISEDVELVVPIKDTKKASGGSGSGTDSGDGSGSQGGSGSGGGNSSDISPSNKEYEKITLEKAKSKLAEIFNKYGLTGSSFTKIYDFVEKNAQENGIPFNTNAEKAAAIDAYIKEHDEYQDMDIEDLEGLVLSYDMVKEMEPSYLQVDNSEEEENYLEELINNLLLLLGYKESEIDEFTFVDVLDLLNENKEKLDKLFKEKLLFSDDYDISELIDFYVIDHYKGLIPSEKKTNLEEVLSNYQDEAIDILNKLGYKTDSLYEMNIYQLFNLLEENEDKINEIFANYGVDVFSGAYGFGSIFTDAMKTVNSQVVLTDRKKFAEYIDNNGYSSEIKNKCLDYFDDGNVKSALYVLQLEDLEKEEINNNNRITELDKEIQEKLVNDPKYLAMMAMGYSYNDVVKQLSGNNDEIKALFDEQNILKNRNKEIGSERYQTKVAIEENSFQYLDNERNTDEYKNAINNSNITADSELLREIEAILSQGKVINMNELNSNNQLSSTLFTIGGLINGYPGDYDDYEGLEVYLATDNDISHSTSSIESVEKTDNGIVVRVKDNGIFVNLKYNTSDGSVIYEFESDGEIVLTTDNPMDYNNINYFELFEYLKSKDEYKDMSKEEFLTTVFGWSSSDMLEYKDPFEMAELTYYYLEDDKIDNFNYLYEVEGIDRANEYLESLRDSIHQRIGMQAALDDLNYVMNGNKKLRTLVVGMENGVQGWTDNVYSFFTKDTTMTPTEYESQYLLSLYASFAKPLNLYDSNLDSELINKIENPESATYLDYYYASGEISEEQYINLKDSEEYQEFVQYAKEHKTGLNYAYMIGQNVGNMLPSVLGSILMAPLGGATVAGHFIGAGQATAGLLMYAGAYGGSYKEAIRSGHDEGSSNLYATLSALSEVATEYFLGRIPGVARISESISPAIYQNIGQLLGIRGINLLKDIGGELLEESLQIWIDYALKKGVLGEEIDLSGWPKEQIDTMVVTTFSTLILGLPSNIAALTNDMSNGPIIKIDENTEIKLSFQEILKLNREYVNSETGKIDMEGLIKAIKEMKGIETVLSLDEILALDSEEERVKEASKLDDIEDKKKVIKTLSYGESIQYYKDENGKEIILIDESTLDSRINKKYVVNQLHSLIGDEDIWYGSIDDVNRILNSKNAVGKEGFGISSSDSDALVIPDTSAYRLTGMSQIEDIIECGYVRINKNARHRGRVVNWSVGRNKAIKTSDGRAIIEVSLDKVHNGQVGAVSLDDITAIWVYDEEAGEYINTIQDVRDAYNENHPYSSGGDVLSQYGTLLYNAKYDVMNNLFLDGVVNNTGNTSLDAILNIDIMSYIKQMEEQSLYNANEMPLSSDSRIRAVQEKRLRGEKLSISEGIVGGRDITMTELGDYKLRSDHVYRAITEEAYNNYLETGEIRGFGEDDEYQEFMKDGVLSHNNKGVDWYLGGACLRYGTIIIECPADTNYFQPAFDNGNRLAQNPNVKHMKSSGTNNPVPMDMVTRVFRYSKETGSFELIKDFESERDNDSSSVINEEIAKYVESYKKARDIIENHEIIGFDENVHTFEYSNNLDNIFQDNTDIAKYFDACLSSNEYNVNKAKKELSTRYTKKEINNFFNNTITGRFLQLLSPDEIEAFHSYSGAAYDSINEYMRTGVVSYDGVKDKVDAIKSLIAKYNSLKSGLSLLLYRGDTKSFAKCSPELTKLLENVGKYDNKEICSKLQSVVGTKFTTNNFFSTSPAYKASFATRDSKNIVFEIVAPPGTNGAYVNSVSWLSNLEYEYLLADGADMRILNVYIGSDGKVHIQTIVENVDSSVEYDDSDIKNKKINITDMIKNAKTDEEKVSLINGLNNSGEKLNHFKYLSYGEALNIKISDQGKASIIIDKNKIDSNQLNDIAYLLNYLVPDVNIETSDGEVLYKVEDDSLNGFNNDEIQDSTTDITNVGINWNSIDLNDWKTSNQLASKPMSDLTLDMLDRIDDAMSAEGALDNAAYYELLNIIGEYAAKDEAIPVDDIVNLINHNPELRESIVNAAKEEVATMLTNMYNVTEQAVIDEIVDNLTGGDKFIEGNIGDNIDWKGFVQHMEGLFKSKISEEIASGKEPVFWSDFDDKYHEAMNNKYTTVEGTTIGSYLTFLDALYPNWNKEGSPKLENLWGLLSLVYSDGVLNSINPDTGANYDNVKFLYPSDKNIQDSFGDIFQSIEFPAILKSKNVNTITLAKTNAETMEIEGTIEIDISDIVTYYNNNLSSNTSNKALDMEVFEMFKNKIHS